MTKRVAVTGASGRIGGALRRHLTDRGDTVVRLVRGQPSAEGRAEGTEFRWDPDRGDLPDQALEAVDAVVNLSGAGIGDHRWTDSYRRLILDSRTRSTATVGAALVREQERSGRTLRLVNGSAVGYYGSRGDAVLTEESGPGDDFLAGVVERWEDATTPAADAGVQVARIRTGLVMSTAGGAFAPVLKMARLGLGGPLGPGTQWWPWITVEDHVRAIGHLIDHPDITGAVNLTSPAPARQRDIAAGIGTRLHRPAVLPAPRLALRLAIGEFSDGIVASARVVPQRLLDTGFTFTHPTLEDALDWLTGN